jgi:hypothetical protein
MIVIDRLEVRKDAVERKPGGNSALSSFEIRVLDAWNFIVVLEIAFLFPFVSFLTHSHRSYNPLSATLPSTRGA